MDKWLVLIQYNKKIQQKHQSAPAVFVFVIPISPQAFFEIFSKAATSVSRSLILVYTCGVTRTQCTPS